MTNVHTSTWPESVEVAAGEMGFVSVVITNTSNVINAYHVEVFGVDPAWVQTTPSTVSLFPGDSESIDISLQLPDDYPASDRVLSLNVVSAGDSSFTLSKVELTIRPNAETSIHLDPVMVSGGRTATFGVVVSNSGNTPITATGFAVDPEALAEFTFDPPHVIVQPGRQQIIQVVAKGGRAWFGQIRPRTFTFGVEAEKRVETLGTFLQRAKISRWLISLLGLLAAAAVFAAVLSSTFGTVVEQAQVTDGVLDAALDPGEAGGAEIPANPSTVTGLIVSSAGSGLSGVQVVLVDATDPAVPLSSASTDTTGAFTFSNLGTGDYLMQLSGAGIDTVWYYREADGEVIVTAQAADATKVVVSQKDTVKLGSITVRGKPVVIAGTIDVADAAGVILRLIVPGQIEAGVDAVVAEVALAPDGSFALTDIPTPGNYILVVEKPGLGAQQQAIVLEPGAGLPELNIVFNSGAGQISGTIGAPSGPLDGAIITAIAGPTTFQTVSLSGPGNAEGTFTLRNLPVPALYTVTIVRPGYATQTLQVPVGPLDDDVALDVNASFPELRVVLIPAIGSVEGEVQVAGGGVPREISVALTGANVERTVDVISQRTPIGAYSFSGLPAPGTYTLTFTGPGFLTQVRVVSIDPRTGQQIAPVGLVVMAPNDRTITGIVTTETTDGQTTAVGQATVVLSNGSSSRTLQTSDDPGDPLGVFFFSDVTQGTYTLSASLPGSVQQVKLIEVNSLTPTILDIGNVALGAQASATGTVAVFEEGINPTQEVQVQRSVLVRLFAPEQFPQGQALADFTTDQATGRWAFQELEATTYIVAVYESDNSDSPLVSRTITLKPGKENDLGELEVTVR